MEIRFSLDEIKKAAQSFSTAIGGRRVFAFYGDMGAGKTTFINALSAVLGSTDETGSPTFSLVNEYTDSQGEPFYHFDFYRIESEAEAADIGAEDYFYSGRLCLIEWPERISRLLPEEAVEVFLTVNPDSTRTLSFPDP